MGKRSLKVSVTLAEDNDEEMWIYMQENIISWKESKNSISSLSELNGFSHGSDRRESICNAGDPGSILGSERSPEEENGNTPQDSRLENPMDRGAWWATVYRVAKSQTKLSN